MEKHKEVFLVIRLHSAQAAASLGPVVDPDPPIQCDLMDGRDAFLTPSCDKHLQVQLTPVLQVLFHGDGVRPGQSGPGPIRVHLKQLQGSLAQESAAFLGRS